MLYLIIVILLNTYIFTVFKLFAKYEVNALQAITVNYWTCVVVGSITFGYNPITPAVLQESWIGYAVFFGAYLIFLFNVLSYSTAKQGMTVTTIANKLSLVIPVLFSWWLYNDNMNAVKVIGIILAFPAVYMATKLKEKLPINTFYLPAIIFILSGLLDTYIKYMQHYHLADENHQSAYTTTAFAVAAVLGTILVAGRTIVKKEHILPKNILAGVLLGLPNYFSIYYFIRLFDSGIMDSSSIVPLNNTGIVLATTFVAILLFKEPANRSRVLGVVLTVISILLIALSNI